MSMWDKFWQEDTHCPKIFGLRNLEKCRKAMGSDVCFPEAEAAIILFEKRDASQLQYEWKLLRIKRKADVSFHFQICRDVLPVG